MQARYRPPLVLAPLPLPPRAQASLTIDYPTFRPSTRVQVLHFFYAQTAATVKRLRLAAAGNRVESGEANQHL
jgi:hypothetical protein